MIKERVLYFKLKNCLISLYRSVGVKYIRDRFYMVNEIRRVFSTLNMPGKFSEEKSQWQRLFEGMAKDVMGSRKHIVKLLHGFAKEPLTLVKKASTINDFSAPIVVCTQKNNIVYLREFIPYYRKLGVKHFVFIDNNSTDESINFLKKQTDVTLFAAPYSFNGIKKAGWKLQALSFVGLNHWFLWLDSDEFLVYRGMEEINLCEYIKRMNEKKIINVGGFMLDMYPEYQLFNNEMSVDDFYKDYKFFDPDSEHYRLVSGGLFGGMRGRCLGLYNLRLDKTPLVYCCENNIPSGNHTTSPRRKHLEDNYGCVLKHYKFLPNEKEKYRAIAKSDSGYASTESLKKYLDLTNVKIKDSKSVKYVDSNSISVFPFVKDFFS